MPVFLAIAAGLLGTAFDDERHLLIAASFVLLVTAALMGAYRWGWLVRDRAGV